MSDSKPARVPNVRHGEGERHFFCSSSLYWTVDTSLERCLAQQRKRDLMGPNYRANGCNIWAIPLPKSAHYEIDNYAPQVEGAEYLAFERYSEEDVKRAKARRR